MGWADAETNTGLPTRRNQTEIQSVIQSSPRLYTTLPSILTNIYFITINHRNIPTHHKLTIATSHHTDTLLIDFYPFGSVVFWFPLYTLLRLPTLCALHTAAGKKLARQIQTWRLTKYFSNYSASSATKSWYSAKIYRLDLCFWYIGFAHSAGSDEFI